MNKKQDRNLVIIGGGLLRKGETLHIDKFIVKLSGKKNPKIIFIPIASNNLREYIKVFKKTYEKLGASVETIELSEDKKIDKNLKNQIVSSDVVYFGGGDVDILKKWINKKDFQEVIKSAYNKGVIISGLSTGAVVWYDYFFEIVNDKPKIKKGIGWIKGLIIPHFKNDKRTREIVSTRKTKDKIIGIEDNCAVYYQNENITSVVKNKKSNAFVFDIDKNKFLKVH